MRLRCSACGSRFTPSEQRCPSCGHRRTGSAGPSTDDIELPTGPLLSAALAVFLISAGLIPTIAHGGWLPGTRAETTTSSDTLVALAQARSSLVAADDALNRGRADVAARELNESQAQLERAGQSFRGEGPNLGPASAGGIEQALELVRQGQAVREAHLAWQRAMAADHAALGSAANVSAGAEALADAEATLETGEEVVDRREEHHRALVAFAGPHPDLASTLDLWPGRSAEGAERVAAANEQRRERVEQESIDLAFTRTTAEQRQRMSPEARERLTELNPPRLRSHFESFDRDGDANLDRDEAAAFFQWVEDEVDYRHDDENATAEIPGTPVGDGRPGTDYQQSPAETFDERMGDCEDTGALQVAFHRYWGSRAYLALLNTEEGGSIDHAAAIVHVGEGPDDVAAVEDGFRTYAFREGNELGVRSGTYAIVDNTYSDEFGTIPGDVEPGSFEVRDIDTLTQSIQRTGIAG